MHMLGEPPLTGPCVVGPHVGWSTPTGAAVDTPAGVYMMGGLARSSAQNLVDGMDALAASWVWK